MIQSQTIFLVTMLFYLFHKKKRFLRFVHLLSLINILSCSVFAVFLLEVFFVCILGIAWHCTFFLLARIIFSVSILGTAEN